MDIKIAFWGSENDERLTHTEVDDAIEAMLDGMDDINALPETIEVCGYTRLKPNGKKIAERVLERTLEDFDDEYGDPDGLCTDATDGMKRAAEVFVATVLEEYTVCECELVKRKTVNVQEWIKENSADWLEESNK